VRYSVLNPKKNNLVVQIRENRAPIWPMRIIGRISHSDRLAAALLDKNTVCLAIGLDIQPVSSVTLAQDLKNIILHPLEIKHFGHQFDATYLILYFQQKKLYSMPYTQAALFFSIIKMLK
jgi:enterobactin synthetase component D